MTGSKIFLCLGLRYRNLTSIWRRCLAPSLHDEWAFMANHIGAYTRMMYVTSVFRFSDGFFFSLTYIVGGFYWRLLAIVSDSGNPGFALPDRLHIHLF